MLGLMSGGCRGMVRMIKVYEERYIYLIRSTVRVGQSVRKSSVSRMPALWHDDWSRHPADLHTDLANVFPS